MIVLNMIVKDESKNMARCFKSVKNIVDKYIICDTGSTDNTKKVIQELLEGKDYEIHDHEWVNFGYNRELALQLAYKSGCDYALIMDADYELKHLDTSNLKADAYYLNVKHGGMDLKQPLLLGLHKEWHWKAPAHNYISGNGKIENLDSLIISHIGEGAKSHCSSREKFLRDAALFENELKKEPNNTRSMFYLAQSYKDAGEYKESIKWYQKRAESGGWQEEIYWSLYQVAILTGLINKTFPQDLLLKAYKYRPQRLEALYEVLHYLRHEQPVLTYSLCDVKVEYPKDSLFILGDIYRWKFKDELALCAYKIGQFKRAVELWESIDAPESEQKRIQDNIKFALNARPIRYNQIYAKVSEFIKGKVLDIGCGKGSLGNYIPDYHGFDIKPGNHTNTWQGNALTEDLSGYDCYTMIEVLEHLDDLAVLSRIPEGKQVVLSVPSFTDPEHLRTYDLDMVINRFGEYLKFNNIIRYNWTGYWDLGISDTNAYILLVNGERKCHLNM